MFFLIFFVILYPSLLMASNILPSSSLFSLHCLLKNIIICNYFSFILLTCMYTTLYSTYINTVYKLSVRPFLIFCYVTLFYTPILFQRLYFVAIYDTLPFAVSARSLFQVFRRYTYNFVSIPGGRLHCSVVIVFLLLIIISSHRLLLLCLFCFVNKQI